jgi:metallo-beta-lactamase family protein
VTAGVSDAPDYSITLWGAAREVQGSCYVVRLGGFCVLVDCGSFMNTEGLPGGSGSHSDNDFSFDPREIDAVLITHAHDDHMGRLPHLVAAGFEGPIYTTGVSKEIIQVKLEDKIGFWECSPVSKDRARRLLLGEGALLRAVSYRERIALADGITATFLNAGHIPGSAAIALTFTLRGEDHTVVFSGDVGSGSHPFLSQPDYSALSAVNADLLVLEATYGGSQRPQTDSLLAEFYSSIREAVDKGNTVVIPSFSLDRTQRVLAAIVAGLQGPYPVLNLPRGVVVGGKLSCLLTRVYVRFQENEPTYNAYFSEAFWSTRPMADPLWTYVRRGEQCDCSDCESPESLDALRRGCNIIVTASGFGSDSDTLSYKLLSRFVTDPMVTFIKVGWAPPDSPMGRLAAAHDANSRIVLLEDGGVPRTQACGFSNVSASFSGHADQTGLITFAKKLGHLARIAVVHGDPDNVKALAAALVSQIPLESSAIYTPMRGQFISLLSP